MWEFSAETGQVGYPARIYQFTDPKLNTKQDNYKGITQWHIIIKPKMKPNLKDSQKNKTHYVQGHNTNKR